MRAARRLLQVVAFVGTLLVGILAVALIVSQTPWFRDWLRRYVVRESEQYVNGQLSIGGLGGNLFFGLQLRDVALDVSGERIVAVKNVEVDYSVFQIVSSGIVLKELKLHQPTIILERDKSGWNLGQLVKKQQKEAEREGPGRPVSLPSIQVTDANVTIRDKAPSASYTLPKQIADLDLNAGYEYAPVHYTITVDHLSFRASSPELSMGKLSGKLAVRDDNLYVEQLRVNTAETTIALGGVIEKYLQTPVIKVTTTGNISLPEIGRIVPAAAPYALHPIVDIKANGPAERLGLDLNIKSEAGNIVGQLTADVDGPAMGAEGDVQVERLNLAEILRNPEQRSDITGRARLDLEIAATPEGAPVAERLSGTFTFAGPRVVAAGYSASAVDVKGRIDGPRIELDGRANAYGGTATSKGFIVTPSKGRPLSFALSGRASKVNLQRLPASTGAPDLDTTLDLARYEVRGVGQRISGSAELNRSTVEGTTVDAGTVAEFSVEPRTISYSARGGVADLDIERMGKALEVAAMAKPEYASRVNGTFDVTGTLPRRPAGRREGESAIAEMTLDASGRLKDSEIMGGRLPDLGFAVKLAGAALDGRLDGQFEGFDPARIAARPDLAGEVTGVINATVQIADVSAPITPESITGAGTLTLSKSRVGELAIETVNLDASYANQVADVKQFTLAGPDVKADASGRVALDRTTASNLKYHVEALDLPELARLAAGQTGIDGTAIVDGTITGNRASLTTSGTLNGSNISYQENNALNLNSAFTVTVPELEFAKVKVDATTKGTFIKAGGLEISELTAKTVYEQQTVNFTTNVKEKTRELDASGTVVLHPDHQELHLPQLALRTAGVEWRSKPGVEATIQYFPDRVELKNVELVNTDQLLSVNGTIALKGDAPSAALDIAGQNIDIQQLEALLLQNRGFAGKLNMNAKVTGTVEAPAVDGHVEIHNGAFKTYKYESFIADIDYVGRRAIVDATLQQTPAERITVKGSAPLSLFTPSTTSEHVQAGPEDAVDLHVTSTALGLGLVQGFTDYVANVAGTIEADVRVTGSGQDPHLQGHIDIRNGAFGVPLGGVSYSGLNTRIDLSPDKVTLQSFQILDEHGEPLSVAGDLAVHEKSVGAVNIRINSANFEIIDNELGDVGLDTSLTISGELRRPKIEGTVRVEAGRIEVDRLLTFFYDPYATESLPAVVSSERMVEGSGSAEEATRAALRKAEPSAAATPEETKPEAPAAPAGVFDAVELDVAFVMPENVVLRGKNLRPGGPTGAALGDMNITIGGEMDVRKAPGDKVRLFGTVETVRGTYEFQGRRFNLERGGRIRFVGETEINPLLDVSATRLIPNTGVEAKVRITGTLQKPELSLTSTPPLEESDILALIVFNRPVNELGTGERSSLAATAGGIATGFIAAPLGESIGRALDLDLFEITTTTESGELGAGITVGQQIGDKAFLKLRQEFGERNTTEFMLEYQLARFLRMQASAAPQTTGSANRLNQRRIERGGLDLIFFFSY